MNNRVKPSTLEKRKLMAKKREIIMNSDEASSSCSTSSSTSSPNSTRRVSRVAHRLRNPTVRLGMARRSAGERQAEALALSLGMSFAAFTNLVLERKSTVTGDQNVYNVDDLAIISASVAKESLVNVCGDKLGSFPTKFERSFKSTLRILKVTNEYAFAHHLNNNNVASFTLDPSTLEGCSDTELSAKETSSATSTYETVQGSARTASSMNELVLNEDTRQLSSMSLTTLEQQRFLEEKARANDLTYMKNFLTVRKLCLKEAELVQMEESNNLKKMKLEMHVSKAAFKAEIFNTKLQDTRKDEMVTLLNDWLVTSVYIMLIAMVYGAYMFSKQRIMECESSSSSEEDYSGWVPKQVSLLHTEFNFLICRLRVLIPSFFSVLVILLFTYFIIQRSSGMKQAMPVSFIVVFLGVFCGLLGKFSVDTLDANGKLWLILWEVFCVLQLVANVYMLPLHGLIYGPVTQRTNSSPCNTMVPYRARRVLFFGVINLVLPAIIGFLPFAATFGE